MHGELLFDILPIPASITASTPVPTPTTLRVCMETDGLLQAQMLLPLGTLSQLRTRPLWTQTQTLTRPGLMQSPAADRKVCPKCRIRSWPY